jgi:hypothetical protein
MSWLEFSWLPSRAIAKARWWVRGAKTISAPAPTPLGEYLSSP